jgi:hypothetical protein
VAQVSSPGKPRLQTCATLVGGRSPPTNFAKQAALLHIALKVDVDTLRGLTEGVPALVNILTRRGIRASFFVALGPDNSGRAIFRAFRQQGFLEKMLRTRAPSVYGFPTMLYGTLLKAPRIAAAASEVLPLLQAAGHEVGLHGYDHVRWHDRVLYHVQAGSGSGNPPGPGRVCRRFWGSRPPRSRRRAGRPAG